MVRAHLVDGRRPHDLLVTDGPGPERVARRVRELAPGLVRHAAGVLLRLLQVSEGLQSNELEAVRRQRGRDHGLGNEVQERAKVVGEALAREHRGMRAHVEPRGRTETIEGVGPRPRVTLRRSAEHGLRGEPRDTGPAGGLEELSGLHREQRRHRAKPFDRDRHDAQPVLQRAPLDVDHPASGMKWPTVRDRSGAPQAHGRFHVGLSRAVAQQPAEDGQRQQSLGTVIRRAVALLLLLRLLCQIDESLEPIDGIVIEFGADRGRHFLEKLPLSRIGQTGRQFIQIASSKDQVLIRRFIGGMQDIHAGDQFLFHALLGKDCQSCLDPVMPAILVSLFEQVDVLPGQQLLELCARRLDLLLLIRQVSQNAIELDGCFVVPPGLDQEVEDAKAFAGVSVVALHLQVRVLRHQLADGIGIEFPR